ncbi:MAG: helix-turn-helix domain-containing protein [Acidimicrobiales bacterium]
MSETTKTVAAGLVLMAREEAGLSQRELAERAGVAQSEIARIESGNREPSIPTLQRLLAGAGLELRFRLAPMDDHDRVLATRQARRSASQKNSAAARHAHNVEQFAANAKRR